MYITKKVIIMAFFLFSIFLLSCQLINFPSFPQQQPAPVPQEQVPLPTPVQEDERLPADQASKQIINSNNPECANGCAVQKVHLKTSDGEEYTLPPGQGSYSYAGALEWKILPVPEYCTAGKAMVPFQFISKTTGKVLGEETVTVAVGEKSKVVTHPTVQRVAFTVEVVSVEEKCE